MIMYIDAIFAIALTLLVIEIHVPVVGHGESLLSALGHEWPKFASFLISFMIISIVWFNHHTMFHYIRKVDHRMILFNMLLMMNVVAIPFCSSVLGEYVAEGGWNATLSALIYGGWIMLGGIPFNLIWNYALKNDRLLEEGYDREAMLQIKKHFNRGPVIYFFVTLLALIHPWLSVTGFAFLTLLYFLPLTLFIRRGKGKQKTEA
jgi:uncharacterized membrane protein